MTQPKVISYIRFSTARQASGDSVRRQTALARQWCVRKGWHLDESITYHDLGLSGFHQDNVTRGALSGFLRAVSEGEIPAGSFLLIENFDRLTRADLPTAVAVLLGIVQAGITCVTLQDEKEWTQESLQSPAEFMMSILMLHRGHDESRVKSERIRAVHDRARKTSDRSVFGRGPGWLRRTEDRKGWEPIPELVEVVRRVFDLSAAGYGSAAIAKRANNEGWPVPSLSARERGTTWHVTLPAKLVRNRAVLGEHEHHVRRNGKSQSTGDVVSDWYPRVIDEALFYSANAAMDSRRNGPPRRDTGYRNIFQGVIFCGHCGATLARKSKAGSPKNSRWYSQYVCSDRHRGVSKCPNTNARELETSLLPLLFRYFSEHLRDDARLTALRDDLSSRRRKLTELHQRRDRLSDAVEQAELPLKGLIQRLEECERQIPALESEISLLEAQLQNSADFDGDDADVISLLDAMREEGDAAERIRVEAHTKIAMAIDCIWVWRRELAMVRLKGSDVVGVLPLPDPDRTGPWEETPDGRVANIEPSTRLISALSGGLSPPTPRRR